MPPFLAHVVCSRPANVLLHAGFIALASYGAFWLRFDGEIPEAYLAVWGATLPWTLVIRMTTFTAFRLFDGSWKYTSLWDLRTIIAATVASSVVIWACDRWFAWGSPRSIHLLSAGLLIALLCGVRLIRRQYREVWPGLSAANRKRVLVYGAGDAGEMIVRDMRLNRGGRAVPIGFVDDDRRKLGQRIHGVPVLGDRGQLGAIMARHRPHEVLLAMPGASPAARRGAIRALEPFKVTITTAPGLSEIVDGHLRLGQIRQLRFEDLLTRAPIGLDPARLQRLVGGRRVLITGAGGSIGAELARQIAVLEPTRLSLLDRSESSLFVIAGALAGARPGGNVDAIVADVTDAARLDAVFRAHRPDVVFHAAAHKHVPLMEGNLCEAVTNNVGGTRLVAQAAVRHRVGRFILISTDKAVNPISVMGASKRAAELTVREIARNSATRFSIVRFGNVLGSSGSVVPHFISQIEHGGPVTVTHPEVSRYFMLISEAVQLVLHAAAIDGESASVYMLEMGEPIRLLDMAEALIRLAGRVPHEEIAVSFIGLRPGDKLHEELVGRDEAAEPSGIAEILRVRPTRPHPLNGKLLPLIVEAERHARRGDTQRVMQCMTTIVPNYTGTTLFTAA